MFCCLNECTVLGTFYSLYIFMLTSRTSSVASQMFYRTKRAKKSLIFNMNHVQGQEAVLCYSASLDNHMQVGHLGISPLIAHPASFLYLYLLFSNRTTDVPWRSSSLHVCFLLFFAPSAIPMDHILFVLPLIFTVFLCQSCGKKLFMNFPYSF